jgi:hypothetical protein
MRLRSAKQSSTMAKAEDLVQTAREAADGGADSVKEFVTHAGSAVRDFASTVSDAAKDLLETTDKAAAKVGGKPRRRGRIRRLLRATIIIGGGAALLANQTVRDSLAKAFRGLRGQTEPAPWNAPPAARDGDSRPQAVPTATS